jgi:DNA (cytosine-5)-methyltransferase 1
MNQKLKVIDLFAGAGGLSLGFMNAGFDVELAIEIDDWAHQTYKANHPGVNAICSDITKLPDSYFEQFRGVDAVVGGPPCQGFSIAASNRRDPNDKRNFLYREFLRVVNLTSPSFVLIENVKEISTKKNELGNTILSEITEVLEGSGYQVTFDILNTKEYKIPQERKRFFLLASKLGTPIFPTKSTDEVTLWEAISDLPEVIPREHKEGTTFNYRVTPENTYQENLRSDCPRVQNHIPMRHTDRIIERFSHISLDNSVDKISLDHQPRKRGNSSEISGKIYSQNHRRLSPDKPSKTITASFYSSFIHPYQNRNLTVREAARLQTFPDSFVFHGLRTRLSHKLLAKKGILSEMHLDQFNQVGNAVPPRMAELLATQLIKTKR